MTYYFVTCEGEDCGLRYPGPLDQPCPRCGASTHLASERPARPAARDPGRARPLTALVDNVRSVYNVGSMFRSADGAGVGQMVLCGITPTPSNPAMSKTALGADATVAWRYDTNAVRCATALREAGMQLWALELTDASEDLFAAAREPLPEGLVMVVGNEVTGVDPGVVAQCSRSMWMPMHGGKESLNVASAFAIAAYVLTGH